MLKLINLYVINSIFDTESLVPISPKAKVAYMQCLTYHFSDMEAKHESLASFNIKRSEVNPKSEAIFAELEKAGLVSTTPGYITFINHWKKYIDKTALAPINVNEYLAMSGYKKADDYREDLLNHKGFSELAQMQFKISEVRVKEMIELFFKTQGAHEQSYPNYQAASRHCLGWMRSQIPNYKQSNQQSVIIKNNAVKQIEPGKSFGSFQ